MENSSPSLPSCSLTAMPFPPRSWPSTDSYLSRTDGKRAAPRQGPGATRTSRSEIRWAGQERA
ncbi:hypothetical protein HDC93_003201 [Streptomyces sp. AK010]|nr:hypothetical protein [Streptomyces sp. AK010]